MESQINLANHFLIAMPNMDDARFERSVILICEHSKDGALGVVINSPLEVTYAELLGHLGHLGKNTQSFTLNEQILWGGPIERDRGFVVHREKGDWGATFTVSEQLYITTSQDILIAIADHKGPSDPIIAFGCARWYQGQLEEELADNVWLTMPASERILFDCPVGECWLSTAALMGVDFNLMPYEMGHA
jgi:putative transcriptional regulator